MTGDRRFKFKGNVVTDEWYPPLWGLCVRHPQLWRGGLFFLAWPWPNFWGN